MMATKMKHAGLALLALCLAGNAEATALNVDIAESLATDQRFEADRKSDPLRRPDLVLEFFGIRPGMTVLDLFSGAGYYTEILSHLVGEGGKVVAHNNGAHLAHARDTLDERFRAGRLSNVVRLTAEADELVLPESGLDAALAILTWHDFYYVDEDNGWPPIDVAALVDTLCSALKPGAVLGVVDHVAETGSPPHGTAQALHRIDPQQIRADLEGRCFVFEGETDVLNNPADDHSLPMYAEGIRGKTDRVVLLFRKES